MATVNRLKANTGAVRGVATRAYTVAWHLRLKELIGVASAAELGKDIIASSLEAGQFHVRMSGLVSLLSEVTGPRKMDTGGRTSHDGFAPKRLRAHAARIGSGARSELGRWDPPRPGLCRK
jgi:hypothetical protein